MPQVRLELMTSLPEPKRPSGLLSARRRSLARESLRVIAQR